MTFFKVGKSEFLPRAMPITYQEIPYDQDGWADASAYLPEDLELMHIKVSGKKVFSGWCIGKHWEGLRLKPEDVVLYWKRNKEF